MLTVGGTQSGGTGNSIRTFAYGGTSNNNFDLTQMVVSTPSTGVSPFSNSATSLFAPGVSPYSVTLGIQITRAAAGTTTGDVNLMVGPVAAVPEPTSIVLAGLGLLALPVARR